MFDWFILIMVCVGLVIAWEWGYRSGAADAEVLHKADKRYTDSGVMSEWQQRAMQDRAQDTEGL